MFRVYGMTFDHTTNYGTCFQSFALGEAIKQLNAGGEPCSYALIPFRVMKGGPRRSVRQQISLLPYRFGFIRFERRYMKFADCRSVAELEQLNKTGDAFVCGSDVIWNPQFNHAYGAYYLDFAAKYKFSYAASFGRAGVTPEQLAPFADSLSQMGEISVREASGLELVHALTDRPACVVADPVFLLSQEDWNRIAAADGKKGGYIFTYTTHGSPTFTDCVNRLSCQTGLPVVHIVWERSLRQRLKQKKFISPSPMRFLQQLRDADYVITNSFHATAFCVLFHKRFFTVVQGEKYGGGNIRMAEFLHAVGLEDRLLSEVPAQLDLSSPDFTAADERLMRLRAESVSFLQRNLDAAYQEKIQSEIKGDLTDG